MPTQKEKFKQVAGAVTSPPIPKTPVLNFPAAMKQRYPELAAVEEAYNAAWDEFQKQLRLIG